MAEELRGVGGWLRLLIILMTVLGPLSLFGQTYGALREAEGGYAGNLPAAWFTYKAIVWAFVAVQLALIFGAGLRLGTVFNRSSVRSAIAALWIAGPLISMVGAITVANRLGLDGVPDKAIAGSIASGFWAAVWTLYLSFSKRVKNTYYASTGFINADRAQNLSREEMIARLDDIAGDAALSEEGRADAAMRAQALRRA